MFHRDFSLSFNSAILFAALDHNLYQDTGGFVTESELRK
jgi:hypothetical protein